jgi:hypothetical protein
MGQLFQQVGATVPGSDKEFHEVTNRLLNGDKPQAIEADLLDKSNQQIASDRKTQAADND